MRRTLFFSARKQDVQFSKTFGVFLQLAPQLTFNVSLLYTADTSQFDGVELVAGRALIFFGLFFDRFFNRPVQSSKAGSKQ